MWLEGSGPINLTTSRAQQCGVRLYHMGMIVPHRNDCTTPGRLYHTIVPHGDDCYDHTGSRIWSEVTPVTLLHCCVLPVCWQKCASVGWQVSASVCWKKCAIVCRQVTTDEQSLIMSQASVDTVRSKRGLNHLIKKLIFASLNQTGSTFTIAKSRGLPFLHMLIEWFTSYVPMCTPL